MSIDFDSFFRNRIETLLIHASWVGSLRSMLGLKGFSQIWNGNAAWYLWLQQAPGVYCLAFSEGDIAASDDQRLFEGRFALKCYPFADHPCFAGYSTEERRLVQSDRFDSTRTPRFEAGEQIPESLFTVGSISLLCDEQENLALLSYQSVDALRIHQVAAEVPEASHPDRRQAAAHMVRNVAGWSIGYPLFDCLVGLYVHFAGQSPAFIGASDGPGFEYTVLADGRIECRTNPEIIQTDLTIGFGRSGSDADRIESIWQSRLEGGERIQVARRLPDSVDDVVGLALPDNFTLNPLWWIIAASDLQTELSSICGCNEPHCSHSEMNVSQGH